MSVLWLDDIRPPWKHGYVGATWVHTADEAIEELHKGLIDFASLDHDLSEAATIGQPAPDERTGYTVILWLEDHPEFWPRFGVAVHSFNPAGKEKMLAVIERRYGRTF